MIYFSDFGVSGVVGAPEMVAINTVGVDGIPATQSINYPSGVQSGDIAILCVNSRSGLPHTYSTPSGFTEEAQGQWVATNLQRAIYYRRLDGSEGASVTLDPSVTTAAGSGEICVSLSIWRGCVSTGSPIENRTNLQSDFTTFGAGVGIKTRTISSPDRTTINFYALRQATTCTSYTGLDEAADFSGGSNQSQVITYKQHTVPDIIGESLVTASGAADWFAAWSFDLIPQTVISSSAPNANDPFINQAKLLCGFEGTDGSTSFVDESPVARTLTAAGNAQIDTAQKKYGSSSYLGDGSGDYVSAVDSDDWNMGALPFTIEGFVRLNATGTGFVLTGAWSTTSANNSFSLQWDATNANLLFADTSDTVRQLNSAWSPSTATWYHFAADREANGTCRIYIDGTVIGSSSLLPQTMKNGTEQLRIGSRNHTTPRTLNGWIDELRITKGVARYGGNFTAPTAVFPRS